jgi:threonyl-tRNA synthetase
VPVADRHNEYAHKVAAVLRKSNVRVEVDTADDTVGEKIRTAIMQKNPVVLVVGDSDVENDTVGMRLRGEDSEERGVALTDATNRIAELVAPPR